MISRTSGTTASHASSSSASSAPRVCGYSRTSLIRKRSAQSAGASGAQGTIGAPGATGAQGAVGATGAQGAQGVQGSPGTLTLNEKSSNYTLVASDNSKIISITAAISITVPSGVFSAGDTVTIVNNTNATRSIVQGSGVTMYTAGTSTTGNKSLIQRGIATVICVSSDTFFISGAGLV